MGQVWKAHDANLDRIVAVKMLRGTLDDVTARERFRREARVLSRLSHPGIATVFDFHAQDDVDFLVMEYVPGGTLESRLATGQLPLDAVFQLGAAIADALENAHRHGVLHRDLKPGNVMLTAEGHPKILDFGLAVLLSAGKATGRMTQSGTIVGSLPYMAPEQLFGEADDTRTDVYALGAMLFEMVTGQRPFVKDRPEALMFAIINNAAPTVRSIRPDAPAELDRLLGECLHKDPAHRPASAATVGDSLRGMRDGGPVVTTVLPVRQGIRAIAVLPFRNVSQDPAQEYFADGMTEAIISDLAHIQALRVISRTSAMRYKGTGLSLPEIARELNVDAVLEGSALLLGDRVRLTVQLISARADETLWAARYDRELEDVLGLQSELAETVAREIAIKLTPTEATQLAKRPAVNPEAHLEFLRSRHSYFAASPQAVEMGLRHARRAIELDPTLAPRGRRWQTATPSARPAAWRRRRRRSRKARRRRSRRWSSIRRSPTHTRRSGSSGRTRAIWPAACARSGRRSSSTPDSPPPTTAWGECFTRTSGTPRRIAADAQGGEPRSALDVHPHRCRGCALLRARVRQVGGPLPDGARARPALRRRAHRPGPLARGARALRRGAGGIRGGATAFGRSRRPDVRAGAPRGARRATRQRPGACSESSSPPAARRVVSAWGIAALHASLGDVDDAFRWLDIAIEERAAGMILLRVHPRLDPIRGDPRYGPLVRRVGLESAAE